MIWIIVVMVWVVGIDIAYNVEFKKKGYDYPVWYSVFWPCMLLLWPIWKLNSKD